MQAKRPNVILVMTDDQGYGDLGCTGNPWIKTPNIDTFHDKAVRLTDFHVSPLCTPTRGGIMSGLNPLRAGLSATCWGRSILNKDVPLMPEVFATGGYKTGMFGKWHLGDNYPYRPQDRGFQKVVAHKGGGVGQTPDFWSNNYFDDTYFHNGKPVSHDGYCTDVWFDEAMQFISENKDEPFFCYLATNAPHGPYLVADKYKKPYENNPNIPEPAFYGMITNIDENFKRLEDKLDELEITDNTILIFMTDNGSSGGWFEPENVGYNAGMRGKKGSYYDGGHRVPFFIRWPEGGMEGGRDIGEFVNHVDLLPTFIDLCGLEAPENHKTDGFNAAPLLRGESGELPDRTIFTQFQQGTVIPDKWNCGVMTKRWRLIKGEELYDIKADPGQKNDIAAQHPEIVKKMRDAHEEWWSEVSQILENYNPISLGNPAENPTRLDSMDVMGDVAWHQDHIKQAIKSCGKWRVDVEQSGTYEFRLRRWPTELGLPIDEILKNEESIRITPNRAWVEIAGQKSECQVEKDAKEATFKLELSAGITTMEAWFADDAKNEVQGAYYVYVTKLD